MKEDTYRDFDKEWGISAFKGLIWGTILSIPIWILIIYLLW